jgi:hypoxanthine phosphoribosyltransferase
MTSESEIQFSAMPYGEFLEYVEVIAAGVHKDGWLPDYIVGIGRRAGSCNLFIT